LRKAQLASARKRRNRRRATAVGVGVVAVAGVGAGAYLGHRYIRGLKGGPKRPSAFNPTYQLMLPAGRSASGMKHINLDVGSKTQSMIDAFDKEAMRAAVRREKGRKRDLKNSRRRQRYWHKKPVANVGYVIPRGKKK
jgi:hypothetical protein